MDPMCERMMALLNSSVGYNLYSLVEFTFTGLGHSATKTNK